MISALFLLTFGLSSWAADTVGFVHGNSLRSVAVAGRVTVFCPIRGGSTPTATFNCRDLVLEPAAYDYFRGPAGVQADEIQLQVLHDDATTRVKKESYDSAKARSASSFNLWISTLFQRPLLKSGVNTVTYTMVQKGTAVRQGQVQVLVEDGPSRTCPSSQYTSQDPNDCTSPFSVCERYFSQYNNCTIK